MSTRVITHNAMLGIVGVTSQMTGEHGEGGTVCYMIDTAEGVEHTHVIVHNVVLGGYHWLDG